MDKYDFMSVIHECFEDCSDNKQLEIRKDEMIIIIEKMFKYEANFREIEKGE